MTETVECTARNGVWVITSSPDERFWGSSKLWDFVSDAAGVKYRTFFTMNLPSDLLGKQVVSATLRKRMVLGTGTRTLLLQRSAAIPNGAYGPITWNNQPGVLAGSTQRSVTQDSATHNNWDFDVTADIAAVAAGAPFYGWRLWTTYTGGKWQGFGWASDYAPVLIVELAEPTTDPVGLEPSGLTSLAKPVFTWAAPPDIVSAQLQIDVDGGNFSAPLFDTGVVSTQVPQLDTNILGFTAGLTIGDVVNVRVRHTTAMGTSAWSDVIALERVAAGALTVSSPGSTTTDPTPTVGWSFTGTQTKWQVTTSRNGVVIADTGIVANGDVVHRPSVGATKAGQVLSYRVRVWGTVDLTPSPGDKGYSEQTITSTYAPGVVTACTSVTAVQDSTAPWVDVSWARAVIPDDYIISRDGEIIERFSAIADGSAVLTYRDWRCPPNTDVEYKVFPVADGVVGSSSPIAEVTTAVDGAWVVDPGTEEFFTFTGDQLNAAYGESSAIYDPTGSPTRVKRTWAMRGLEGTVAGFLDDHDGHTAADMYADFLSIKGRPSTTVRLVLPDRNIPAILSDMSDTVNAESMVPHRVRKDLSFSFFQDGENPFPEVAP